jgi:hypothetical protein
MPSTSAHVFSISTDGGTMTLVRKKLPFVSVLMVTLVLWLTVPFQSVLAAMVPTERSATALEAEASRDFLKALVSRDDVQNALLSNGIEPEEAKARIDSLSDSEVIRLAGNIDALPAGGSAVGVIVGALLIVFLVLLVTDIMGYTDVFPFVKSQK